MKFVDIWNTQREEYNKKRASVYDDRTRRIPQLFNSDVIDLFSQWSTYFGNANASIDSAYWNKLKKQIHDGVLAANKHLLYTDYKSFWANMEAIAKEFDSLGVMPSKSSTSMSKFVIISVALVAGLLLLGKRK